jgi:putative aldouronate transport system permease protein
LRNKGIRIDNDSITMVFIYTLLSVFSIICIYPVIYTYSIAFSNYRDVTAGRVVFLPVNFDLEGILVVLRHHGVLRGYWNTIVYSILATFTSILFTTMLAYPLSIKTFPLKGVITVYLTITLFFAGGLIPQYMLARNLGIINTMWVMILPGAVGAWNVIIYRTFFKNVPSDMRESAFIDGAGEVQILFRIMVPLSKPLFAAMALFSMVAVWNDYFTPMIFLSDKLKWPVQVVLSKLLFNIEAFKDKEMVAALQADQLFSPRVVKAAAVVVTLTPIMCVYPFIQKYFAKGIYVGAIKG